MICGTFTATLVPADQLAGVMQGYRDNVPPPLRVTSEADGAGTFTVTATFPPCDQNTSHDLNGQPGPVPPPGGNGPVPAGPPGGPSAKKADPPKVVGADAASKGQDILLVARAHIGEKYIFGTAVPYRNSNWKGPWDCAEFATWCVYQAYGFLFGCDAAGTAGSAYTGLWKDDSQARGKSISVEDAIRTPGAFLLRYPVTSTRTIGHVAISSGDGSTVEAADSTRGVIAGTVFGRRWDTGVLLPGVEYGVAENATPDLVRAIEFPNPDPRVKEIQLALAKQGYDPGPIDGLFGETTESAVAAFQAAKGFVIDGEVGSQTATALFATPAVPAQPGVPLPASAVGLAPKSPAASRKFADLGQEYLALFNTLVLSAAKTKDIKAAADRVLAGKARYQSVSRALGAIPWYVVGVINELESTSKFTTHLHNGDPLTGRTTHVPAGRPLVGYPPFSWEESAEDALTLQGFNIKPDWYLSITLFRLEGYNGFGSRGQGIFTPYLWSGCQHYVNGKYNADGSWDPQLVSSQIGCAVILKILQDRGELNLDVR
jgi:N-acetylmuramoyl-L-alanine amidase